MTSLSGDESTHNVIELRLPLEAEHVAVLRAATGAIAGTISFNYDEIMQLRVAVVEVFEIAIRQVARQEHRSQIGEFAALFELERERMQILATYQPVYRGRPDTDEQQESEALLESLMDEVDFGIDTAGQASVRMVKYKTVREA